MTEVRDATKVKAANVWIQPHRRDGACVMAEGPLVFRIFKVKQPEEKQLYKALGHHLENDKTN